MITPKNEQAAPAMRPSKLFSGYMPKLVILCRPSDFPTTLAAASATQAMMATLKITCTGAHMKSIMVSRNGTLEMNVYFSRVGSRDFKNHLIAQSGKYWNLLRRNKSAVVNIKMKKKATIT